MYAAPCYTQGRCKKAGCYPTSSVDYQNPLPLCKKLFVGQYVAPGAGIKLAVTTNASSLMSCLLGGIAQPLALYCLERRHIRALVNSLNNPANLVGVVSGGDSLVKGIILVFRARHKNVYIRVA